MSALTGKVKFYNIDKGFGFIKPDNGGDDVFVHRTALERSRLAIIREDETYEYDLAEHRGRVSVNTLVKV